MCWLLLLEGVLCMYVRIVGICNIMDAMDS
jgi:hypothetical protein